MSIRKNRKSDPLRGLGRLVGVLALSVLIAASATAAPQERDMHRLFMHGGELSAAEAEKLHEKIKNDPNEVEARLKLLGYYFQARHSDKQAKSRRLELVEWAIANHPDADWMSLPELSVDHILDPTAYQEMSALWQKQLAANATSAIVHGNASEFFMFGDRQRSAKLLQQAQELEPKRAEWSQRLGRLYALEVARLNGDERRAQAKKSLAEFERAMSQETDDEAVESLLTNLAKLAFEAGEFDKAQGFAERMLTTAANEKKNWNTGNLVHHGHLVLGRLALHAGDLEKAKAELLEAGKTTGSPQLDSFGPNMLLAKELLEKGERETVLAYFDLCRTFWKGVRDGKQLDDWAATVKGGGVPKFGGNLAY